MKGLHAQFAGMFLTNRGKLLADTDSANYVWNHFSGKQKCDVPWMATRFHKKSPFMINAAKGKYSTSNAVASTKIEIAIGKENSEILRPMKLVVNMVTYSALPVVRQ